VPWVRRLVRPAPLPLVVAGTLQRHNMRRELLIKEKLLGLLRERGVDDLTQVRRAYLEGDGQLSVIQKHGGPEQHGRPRNKQQSIG
jgi:uncharacterized membrane protein YcaP (DUF421 family)